MVIVIKGLLIICIDLACFGTNQEEEEAAGNLRVLGNIHQGLF